MNRRSSRQALARSRVQDAKQRQRILPRPCEVCGSTEQIQAHHENYAAPLQVRWLCPMHHGARHAERRALGLDPPTKHLRGPRQPRPLMTLAEAADYLNLTPKALRRRVERRVIPFIRLGPRTIRFNQFTLDVWMRESERYAERRSA